MHRVWISGAGARVTVRDGPATTMKPGSEAGAVTAGSARSRITRLGHALQVEQVMQVDRDNRHASRSPSRTSGRVAIVSEIRSLVHLVALDSRAPRLLRNF